MWFWIEIFNLNSLDAEDVSSAHNTLRLRKEIGEGEREGEAGGEEGADMEEITTLAGGKIQGAGRRPIRLVEQVIMY